MNILRCILWVQLCLLWCTTLQSQTIVVENVTQGEISVCNNSQVEYSLRNTSPLDLNNVQLIFECPPGLEYVPGSIASATEVDISDLGRPVFSLDLDGLQEVIIGLFLKSDCSIFEEIQAGGVFINKLTLEHPTFNLSYEDNPPYRIETGFLVIQPISINTYISGQPNVRNLSITNTRLGPIRQMELRHQHDELSIQVVNGQLQSQNNDEWLVLLGAAEFRMIGDGDDLFETGETWEQMEILEHPNCQEEILSSFYTVSWGCEGEMCQSDTFGADMIFKPTTMTSRLRVQEAPFFPECPCAPAQQCLTIENIRGSATDNTEFWFEVGDSIDALRGIEVGSITINGGSTVIDSIAYNTQKKIECSGLDFSQRARVFLSNIIGGDNFELCFTYQQCVDTLFVINAMPQLRWRYGYEHGTLCNPNDFQINRGANVTMKRTIPEATYSFGGDGLTLENDTILAEKWTIEGQELLDSGSLTLSHCFPCMLIPESPFEVDQGIAFSSSDTIYYNDRGITQIHYHFDLPLPVDFICARATLRFTCDAPCLDSVGAERAVLASSTCPNPSVSTNNLFIGVTGNIFYTPCGPENPPCVYEAANTYSARVSCELKTIRRDSIGAYILFDGKAGRVSFGDRDENGDRRKELGKADATIADELRFTFSDTILASFQGVIVEDQPGTYDSLVLMIQPGTIFDPIDAKIIIVDRETGERFSCSLNQGSEFGTPAVPPPACGYNFTSGGFPRSVIFSVTEESLAAAGCPRPGFQLTDGDSIYAEVRVRSVYHNEIEADVDFIQRMEIYDRSKSTLRYTCEQVTTKMLGSSLILNVTAQGSFNYDACNSNPLNGYHQWTSTDIMDDFFPNEYRSLIQFTDATFRISDGLSIDSVLVTVLYRNVSDFDTLRTVLVATEFNNGDYSLPIAFLDSLDWDEGAIIQWAPFVEVSSCEEVRVDPNISFQLNWEAKGDYQYGLEPNELQPTNVSIQAFNKNARVLKPEVELIGGGPIIFAYDSFYCANYILRISDPVSTFYVVSDLRNNTENIHRLKANGNILIERLDEELTRFSVPEAGEYNIQICYSNSTCQNDSLDVEIFWTCGDSEEERCYNLTDSFEVRKVGAELEMDVFAKDQVLEVCDTSEFLVVDLFGADLGSLYDLQLTMNQLVGLEILEGSVEVDYPVGSGWQTTGLSTDFVMGELTWNIVDVLGGRDGLPGITEAPFNQVQLRFKVVSSCELIGGQFFKFSAMAIGPCGEPSNSVTKNSGLFSINGSPALLDQDISMELIPEDCEDVVKLKVVLITRSEIAENEKIVVTIPGDGGLKENGINPLRNIENQNPIIEDRGNLLDLIYTVNPLINAGDSVVFEIELEGVNHYRCSTLPVSISAQSKFNPVCVSTGEICEAGIVNTSFDSLWSIPGVKVLLDSAEVVRDIDLDLLKMAIELTYFPDTFSLDLNWRLLIDDNGDGLYQAEDTIVVDEGLIQSSEIVNDSFCYTVDLSDINCNYILIVDGDCLCSSDTLGIDIDQPVKKLFKDTICSGDSLLIGQETNGASQYTWEVGGVPCDTCPMNVISPTVIEDSVLNYVLFVDFDMRCDLELQYQITVQPRGLGMKDSLMICPEEFVELTSQGVVDWMGPGISERSRNLTFIPDSSVTIYAFSVEERCAFVDTFCVFLKAAPTFRFVSADTIIDQGDSTVLMVEGDFDNVTWTPAESLNCDTCRTVIAFPNETTTYDIQGFGPDGCPKDTQITVSVIIPTCDESSVFIPNAFSPNNDSFNDTWGVRGRSVEEVYLVVYNRWGEKIFETKRVGDDWDGTYKDQPLSNDVFAFYAEVLCVGGEQYVLKGNVTLLK